jgi:RecA/RadA recombinase
MARPYDITKIKKFIEKSVPGMSYGYNDPTTWISTGCYALNYMAGNNFKGGIPLEGKITMFAGDSGSGKSYIGSANIVKWCQENDVWPVLIDTENALDKSWMEPLGVKTDEDSMDKLLGSTVDDVSKFIGELIEQYRERNDSRPYEERDKMCIIIDSLGMLITPNQEKQFMAGDQKGDMGIKAKQVTAMLRVLISKIGAQRIGIVLTNHVYNSQDIYTPDQIAGGMMVEFSTSLLIQMNKWMLKEDEDGKETKEITGIRTTVVVRKSRYAKPFEKVKISIPYEFGMDPYSGLFELFEKKGIIQGSGWYTYTSPATGEVFRHQGRSVKKWKAAMDQIMDEWKVYHEPDGPSLGFDETESAKAGDLLVVELNEIDAMIANGEVPLAKEKKVKK